MELSQKKIAFFHGLESVQPSEKSNWLNHAFLNPYCPAMDYTDPTLFERVLKEVQDRKIDLLIGSSMGGYFAYCISTLTGIPTVLFNPAMVDRHIEPPVRIGECVSNQEVIYGLLDAVICCTKVRKWFDENGIGAIHCHQEFIGHRTPMAVFTKYVTEFTDF